MQTKYIEEKNMQDAIKSLDSKTKRIDSDHNYPTMENGRKEWVPAIPLPFFGLKKRCSCGKSFWKHENYLAHYALHHIVLGDLPL